MHLPTMTAEGLQRLSKRLLTISAALRTLEPLFPGVTVDLTPDRPAVIHLPVIIDLGDPGVVDLVDALEDQRLETQATVTDFEGSQAAVASIAAPVAVAAPVVPPAPVVPFASVRAAAPASAAPAAAGAARVRAAPVRDGASFLRGPLSEDERAQIMALHLEGQSNAEIALRLGRRVQAVGLYLANAQVQADLQQRRGMRPIGDVIAGIAAQVVAQRAVAPVAEAVADPVAEVVVEMPGGDQGGLQQHRPAEQDPVQAVEAVKQDAAPTAEARPEVDAPKAAAVAPPAPAPVAPAAKPTGLGRPPEDASGEVRRIWVELNALGYRGGWDADLDQELVEMLVQGVKTGQVALDLGMDTAAIKARWVALTNSILDAKGRVTIDGQKHLLEALKLRVVQLRHSGEGQA